MKNTAGPLQPSEYSVFLSFCLLDMRRAASTYDHLTSMCVGRISTNYYVKMCQLKIRCDKPHRQKIIRFGPEERSTTESDIRKLLFFYI